ncbi:putative reverse transcriptase domain-containing protein [Tanacetum coccineum]
MLGTIKRTNNKTRDRTLGGLTLLGLCKKIVHLACDCRSSGPNGNNNNHGNSETTQNAGTCYECGVQGHFKRDCLKLKNRNRGNQGGNGNAPAKVYMVGNERTNSDSNVITEDRSTSTLSIGFFRNERVVKSTTRTIRQRLYKTQFFTLGSSSLVCQKEGRITSNVHRLSGIEQANREESLSTPED